MFSSISALQCCIASQNRTDPVIDKDGDTYERAAIEPAVDELGPRRAVLNAISELSVENAAESEKKELSYSSKVSQVEKYKLLPHMDKNNALIARVWAEKGVEEAVNQMFVHPEDGSSLGYAEMRSFYG